MLVFKSSLVGANPNKNVPCKIFNLLNGVSFTNVNIYNFQNFLIRDQMYRH